MDYFERLILRALAVPRDHDTALFDPFEQAAALEEVLPPATVRPTVADAHAVSTSTAQAHTIAAEPAFQPEVVTQPGAATSLRPLQPTTAVPVPAPVPAPMALVSSVTEAVRSVRLTPPASRSPAAATPDAGPLAQADAFFRELGVPSVPVAEAPPRRPAAHEPEAPPGRRARAAVPDTPVPMLQPPRRAMAPEHPPVSSRAAPPAAAAAGPAPATAPNRAAGRTAPAASVVQTTAVVQRSATRWADELGTLARGSPMGRFGRGQW